MIEVYSGVVCTAVFAHRENWFNLVYLGEGQAPSFRTSIQHAASKFKVFVGLSWQTFHHTWLADCKHMMSSETNSMLKDNFRDFIFSLTVCQKLFEKENTNPLFNKTLFLWIILLKPFYIFSVSESSNWFFTKYFEIWI